MALFFFFKIFGKVNQGIVVVLSGRTTRIVLIHDRLESLGKISPGNILLKHLLNFLR
jgi:hypothetical protein